MSFGLNSTEYHGNLSGGYLIQSYGKLTTDRYLLDTCTAIFIARRSDFALLPNIGSVHPQWNWISMEHREMSIEGPWAIANCDFAGVVKDTIPIYELCGGLGEEPIETHPQFVSKIGGSPSAPKNGATFRSVANPPVFVTAANKASSDAGYVFNGFEIFTGSVLNTLAGVRSYLAADQITWKFTQNFLASNFTYGLGTLGKISTPMGPAPSLPSGGNWLDMGFSTTLRGGAIQVVKEWRASGRRGWNSLIYG